MDKYKYHKGKVDRRKVVEAIRPKALVEHAIEDVRSRLQSTENLTNPELVELYLSSRNNRHEVWINYLNNHNDFGIKYGDVNFGLFCESLNIPEPDRKLRRLTPDILFQNPDTKYVFLGDVSVSVSTALANNRKYIRYKPLKDHLEKHGLTVKHYNFIVNEDLSNVHNLLNEAYNMGLVDNTTEDLRRLLFFANASQWCMNECFNCSPNRQELKTLIDTQDKIEKVDPLEINVPKELHVDMTSDRKKLSELEIIQMIKDEVESIGIDNYFDNGVDSTIEEFNKLEDSYANRDTCAPKSILKVADNQMEIEESSGYDLLESFIYDLTFNDDNDVTNYIRHLLPTGPQIDRMREWYNKRRELTKAEKDSMREYNVFGPHQYRMRPMKDNRLVQNFKYQLSKGKKTRNEKNAPKTIHRDNFDICRSDCERLINYYGTISKKPPFLDDSWDSATEFENDNSKVERENYHFAKSTCGAQLAHSLSGLYQRISHLKIGQGKYDNIYIPPNGSFICVIPSAHAPVSNKNCDLPFIFITRVTHGSKAVFCEYEQIVDTDNYRYYVTSLSRLNIEKIQVWDQAGYRLTACISHILSVCPELIPSKNRVAGLLTLLMLDCHQKPSEYLDLLKYVSYMPYSDISRLSSLVKDKFQILLKTSLDVWLLLSLKDFIIKLADTCSIDAAKPKLQIYNNVMTKESQGICLKLPSFIDQSIRHKSAGSYIEEMGMLFIIRGKHLYGSQFLDQSITKVCEWNEEYSKEVEDYGDWAVNGQGEGKFPFQSKYCYSSDAIQYAMEYAMTKFGASENDVLKELSNTTYGDYMHNNCSLRGCTKEADKRLNAHDLHTTSMDECLKAYVEEKYEDEKCTTIAIGLKHIISGRRQQYSMSEKDQRGSGRPIATPTLGTKASLCLIEKPEQAIGSRTNNNILVAGKNKLREMSECYKHLVSSAALKGYKQIYQLTEDQSKFSENDNTRKYRNYIKTNTLLGNNVRAIQLAALDRVIDREHLTHRLPKNVISDKNLSKYINKDGNGVWTNIGWPQGMLNNISTSIHSHADYWITRAYNIAYPKNKVETSGLVHSDDSWVAVACNSIHDFKRFTLFRIIAKKLFCLKVNEKKLWGSKYLGELVSNYNLNGTVHLSISKILANSFCNLLYINWPIDVHSQISAIQQAMRNGASQPTLILMATILRQQITSSYMVKGTQLDLLHLLPIELGGYPKCSVFELGVNGLDCHYQYILNMLKREPTCKASIIILKALTLSVNKRYKEASSNIIVDKEDLMDAYRNSIGEAPLNWGFNPVVLPSRGEIFCCISHLLPMTNKLNKTIVMLNQIPYETDGLENIITKPKDLASALGHLKATTKGRIYHLAAEHYSNNVRRLAMCQSLQSGGKTVRLFDTPPLTMNEMLNSIYERVVPIAGYELAESALTDESKMSQICEAIVYMGVFTKSGVDKRKIINKLPEHESRYRVISRLRNVLLFMIDQVRNSNLLSKYGDTIEPNDILVSDSVLIRKRFSSYFSYYSIEKACSLIMMQSMDTLKTKLWMQPYLRNDNMKVFLEDLYGKTVSMHENFGVTSELAESFRNKDSDLVDSIYSTMLLNKMYPGSFEIESISGSNPDEVIAAIDYKNLSGDHYLKYGIIKFVTKNDDSVIRSYDQSKQYRQNYRVRQQRNKHGAYEGRFIVQVQYGPVTIEIHHDNYGNTDIVSNSNHIYYITNAMMQFVNRNFKEDSYTHPHRWSECPIYRNRNKFGRGFLTSYRQLCTTITTTPQMDSIPFRYDPNLGLQLTASVDVAAEYSIDEDLRVVTKKVDDKTYRIGNAIQNLRCPMSKVIEIKQSFLDGIDNQMLYKNGLIFNISMRRFGLCSVSDIRTCLEARTPSINSSCLVKFYLNLLSQFKKIDINLDDYNDEEFIIDDVDIHGITPVSCYDDINMTTAEDLSCVVAEYEFTEDEKVQQGSISKFTSISRILATIMSRQYSHDDISNMIHILLNDSKFTNVLFDDIQKGQVHIDDVLVSVIEVAQDEEIDTDIYSLIMGHKLDQTIGWANLKLRNIMSSNVDGVNNLGKLLRIANKISVFVTNFIHGMDEENKVETLKSLLK
ncbi:RNA-dependent RNA polymerase [Hubei odonate virus 8]|uniref:RNA-directed RNA polymerase L n=1 Tax=Hubei odonate virus 8 TaxID=1923003 RepID=A0A1L3KPG4_9VIRU|nr:RNA-dependent RNA polymerase [Hubei odonate virus 8]APG79264.1 RNA-dependent RNA polymerase [Hubei odonate virus 8]